MKRYLSSTPTLVAPKPQEKLLLYIAAANQVVSAALVAEREADDEPATTTDVSSDKQGGFADKLWSQQTWVCAGT